MQRLVRFWKTPFTEKILFAEAVGWMLFSKLCLLLFSFKYCIKLTHNKSADSNTTGDIERLVALKKAVTRANYLAVWNNKCLVQSLTARWMLNRRDIGSELKLGVTHDTNKKVTAHAWVNVHGYEVVNKGADYHELVSF